MWGVALRVHCNSTVALAVALAVAQQDAPNSVRRAASWAFGTAAVVRAVGHRDGVRDSYTHVCSAAMIIMTLVKYVFIGRLPPPG